MSTSPKARFFMKRAVVAAVIALSASACAPGGQPANVPISTSGKLISQVVDSSNDAGLGVSAALDQDGNPALTYFMFKQALKPGELPAPVVAGQPQPPAVMLATQDQGIWGRAPVTPQERGVTPEQVAKQIANEEGQAVPGVATATVVDSQGNHHVAWSTPVAVFYSTDAGGSFGEPEEVTGSAATGVSLAVAPEGTPWISFRSGKDVRVAAGGGGRWKLQTVNAASSRGSAAARGSTGAGQLATAIRLTSGGQPVVAYGAGGKTWVARTAGTAWKPQQVPGSGGLGVSLTLDTKDNPHLAYYDSSGTVHHADSLTMGQWEVTDLQTGAGQPGPDWSTGIAVDDQGVHYVTWVGGDRKEILLATDSGGDFSAQPVPNSAGGADPSIAVSADGKALALAWYDTANSSAAVATFAQAGGLVLAFPTPGVGGPPAGPSAPPTSGGGGCEPSGTTVQVAANGIAFDKDCLAAPAGGPFTIAFSNEEAVPHNVAIYESSSFSPPALFTGEIVTGPTEVNYKVEGLDPGDYAFKCDVHSTMTGSFVVAK